MWSASHSCCFTPGERIPITYWIGGWEDPKLGLEVSCPAGIRTLDCPAHNLVIILTTLSWCHVKTLETAFWNEIWKNDLSSWWNWGVCFKRMCGHILLKCMSELAGMHGTPAKHPPCNLGLTHCDFWIFPKLKQELQGRKFSSGIQVMYATAATLCKKS
jgi:hypothetical protein